MDFDGIFNSVKVLWTISIAAIIVCLYLFVRWMIIKMFKH